MSKSKRIELHNIFINVLGSSNVYFQPPSTIKLQYPCIIYQLSNENVLYSDNIRYKHAIRYQVTFIDSDPDTEIPDKIRQLPYTSFERRYTSDNLNHDVFSIFY